MVKLSFCAAILAFSTVSFAQVDFRTRTNKYVTGFFGQSSIVLGSRDIRQGGGIALGYERPEPRFSFGGLQTSLSWEGYIDRTYSVNKRNSPETGAFGVLAVGRWYGNRDRSGQRFFWGGGWGLQYANRPSPDLDSKINSTPMVELGTTLPVGNQEFIFGLRYLHLSNAGLVGRNRGSNQLFLTIGVRF